MKKVHVIHDIGEYRITPPLTGVFVDYETVKLGLKVSKSHYPQLRMVSEEDLFKKLSEKLTNSYDLTEKVRLYMLAPNNRGSKESKSKGKKSRDKAPNGKERFMLGRKLEKIGYNIVFAKKVKDYYDTLSFNLIDFVFKNRLDEIILISSDVRLGMTFLMLKNSIDMDLRWEIWKFEGFYDPCVMRKFMDDGIIFRNLDYMLFSSILKS